MPLLRALVRASRHPSGSSGSSNKVLADRLRGVLLKAMCKVRRPRGWACVCVRDCVPVYLSACLSFYLCMSGDCPLPVGVCVCMWVLLLLPLQLPLLCVRVHVRMRARNNAGSKPLMQPWQSVQANVSRRRCQAKKSVCGRRVWWWGGGISRERMTPALVLCSCTRCFPVVCQAHVLTQA